MKELNLSKCKTNKEVCDLVTKRVLELSFEKLLKKVEEKFIYQKKATKAIYTGLSMNMNVFLSGPGGFGKSNLIKYILDIYKIPYTTIVGYKDMPVDALLGIPNMDKLLNESEYEINFKASAFYKPGILIGEEFTDILPSTAAALKDILTEKGFRYKDIKIESLVSSMIIAANKNSSDVSLDKSTEALYNGRFPIQIEVIWESFKATDYFKLLKLVFKNENENKLFFMSKLFEYNVNENNILVPPRTAIDITKAFLKYGIKFIDSFSINTEYIDTIQIEAEREFIKLNVKSTINDIKEIISEHENDNIHVDKLLNYYYFVHYKLRELKIYGDNIKEISSFKHFIESKIESAHNKMSDFDIIQSIINNITHDKKT